MIFDALRHVELYNPSNRVLSSSIDFIQNNKFSFNKSQMRNIGTEGIYALAQEYPLKKKEERVIESHRKYIDVHVMMSGMEYLGYADKTSLHVMSYDEEHDSESLTGTLAFLPFPKDFFAVLFPQDAHMTGVQGQGSTASVKKIVIKVPLDLWQVRP